METAQLTTGINQASVKSEQLNAKAEKIIIRLTPIFAILMVFYVWQSNIRTENKIALAEARANVQFSQAMSRDAQLVGRDAKIMQMLYFQLPQNSETKGKIAKWDVRIKSAEDLESKALKMESEEIANKNRLEKAIK